MEWRLARVTTDLLDDPMWNGIVLGAVNAPSESLFFSVGTRDGALVHDGRWISVRIGWIDDAGDPVNIKGTCTVEPVVLDPLPRAPQVGQTAVGQVQQVVSVGEPLVDVGAWYTWPMPVQPYGRWTVRLSGMTAIGATRAAVWYLVHP